MAKKSKVKPGERHKATFYIPKGMWAEVKSAAAQRQMPIFKAVVEALQDWLRKERSPV